MVERISAAQFSAAGGVEDWRVLRGSARAHFRTGDFATGLRLVDEIGRLAEAANHHPDIRLGYPLVVVSLTTHDAGGLSHRDVDLARAISGAARELGVVAGPAAPDWPSVSPTDAERSAVLPGDELLVADVVMDRAMTLPASPERVWPWLLQLGKRRAGWYLPRSVERAIPRSRRAARTIDARWQGLAPDDVIPDWGGRDASFTAVRVDPMATLLYRSTRGHTHLTWCLHLTTVAAGTRLHLRLRLQGVKHGRMAEVGGGALDLLTVKGLAAGLCERLGDHPKGHQLSS